MWKLVRPFWSSPTRRNQLAGLPRASEIESEQHLVAGTSLRVKGCLYSRRQDPKQLSRHRTCRAGRLRLLGWLLWLHHRRLSRLLQAVRQLLRQLLQRLQLQRGLLLLHLMLLLCWRRRVHRRVQAIWHRDRNRQLQVVLRLWLRLRLRGTCNQSRTKSNEPELYGMLAPHA